MQCLLSLLIASLAFITTSNPLNARPGLEPETRQLPRSAASSLKVNRDSNPRNDIGGKNKKPCKNTEKKSIESAY